MADKLEISMQDNNSSKKSVVTAETVIKANKSIIKTLKIKDGIEKIDRAVFEGWSNLEDVTLPDSLTEIGDFAFFDCKKLKTINLGNSITKIGRSAFQNCEALEEARIPSGVKVIDSWTFAGCKNLSTIIIGDGVTKIGHQAFAWCDKLNKVEFIYPNNIELGNEIFYNSKKCKLRLPLLGRIENMFNGKLFDNVEVEDKTSDVLISEGIVYQNIDGEANKLKVVGCDKNIVLANIKGNIMVNNIAYTVTSIEADKISGLENLELVIIPPTISEIGNKAFTNNKKLNSITIIPGNPNFCSDPAQRTIIRKQDDSQTIIAYAIGNEAYSFNLPISVTKIAEYAFSSFRYLKRIVFTNEVEFMTDNVFEEANVEDCHAFVSKDASSEFRAKLESYNFKSVTNSEYFIHEGINYKILSEDDSTVEVADNRNYVGEVEIPKTLQYAGVTYTVIGVGDRAFDLNEKVTSVKLPDSIKKVGNLAFQTLPIFIDLPSSLEVVGYSAFTYNKFTDLILPVGIKELRRTSFGYTEVQSKRAFIPNTVTTIDDNPFYNSTLESIEVASDNPNFKSIDGVLFNKDGSKILVYPAYKSANSYTIPSGVKIIGRNFFANNHNLKELSIPISVIQLESCALWSCPSLRQITISATTPPTVLDKALNGVSDSCIIKVPKGYVNAYKNAEGWNKFKRITDGTLQRECFKHEGINYRIIDHKEKKLEVQYNYKCTMKEVNIPATINLNGENYTVEKIGQRAFFNNKKIERITLPNTIKTIGYKAFGSTNCIISSIPSSVEVIESKAFYRINEKNQFTIPQNIRSIHPKAFLFSKLQGFTEQTGTDFQVLSSVLINNKESQVLCYPSTKNLEKLQLPTKVTNLGRHAFYCVDNLTTIVVPATVNSIEFSFWGADKLQQLVILSKKPPKFIGSSHLKKRCPIIVPKGCVNVYKNHPDWRRFTNIKEMNAILPTSNMAGYGISKITLK